VFGYLDLLDGAGGRIARFCTAEEDWRNNAPKVSCIVAGSYICHRVVSPKFGDVFEIANVPGRSAILIHAGNTEEDVEGCVLLGERFGGLVVADEDDPAHPRIEKWSIAGGTSRPALKRFMGLLAGLQTFPLEVRWATPAEWR
jgi:hypothetical protein